MIQVNRIYLIFNRLVTKKFFVDTSETITLETKDLTDFTFVWFTDGKGWNSARRNLEETFDVLEHIYNINDMENGIISKIMK